MFFFYFVSSQARLLAPKKERHFDRLSAGKRALFGNLDKQITPVIAFKSPTEILSNGTLPLPKKAMKYYILGGYSTLQ